MRKGPGLRLRLRHEVLADVVQLKVWGLSLVSVVGIWDGDGCEEAVGGVRRQTKKGE